MQEVADGERNFMKSKRLWRVTSCKFWNLFHFISKFEIMKFSGNLEISKFEIMKLSRNLEIWQVVEEL